MINISDIVSYYDEDMVFMTGHAAERIRERGIRAKDIRHAVVNGEIIEQYPTDYPFPSCLILGCDETGKSMHVCLSDEGSSSRIITAYYPDENKWSSDYRTRKEDSQ